MPRARPRFSVGIAAPGAGIRDRSRFAGDVHESHLVIVSQGGDRLLCGQNLAAAGTLAAVGQAAFRAGGGAAGHGHRSMVQSRDFLRNIDEFSADGAFHARGDARFRTGGFHARYRFVNVPRCENDFLLRQHLAADGALNALRQAVLIAGGRRAGNDLRRMFKRGNDVGVGELFAAYGALDHAAAGLGAGGKHFRYFFRLVVRFFDGFRFRFAAAGTGERAHALLRAGGLGGHFTAAPVVAQRFDHFFLRLPAGFAEAVLQAFAFTVGFHINAPFAPGMACGGNGAFFALLAAIAIPHLRSFPLAAGFIRGFPFSPVVPQGGNEVPVFGGAGHEEILVHGIALLRAGGLHRIGWHPAFRNACRRRQRQGQHGERQHQHQQGSHSFHCCALAFYIKTGYQSEKGAPIAAMGFVTDPVTLETAGSQDDAGCMPENTVRAYSERMFLPGLYNENSMIVNKKQIRFICRPGMISASSAYCDSAGGWKFFRRKGWRSAWRVPGIYFPAAIPPRDSRAFLNRCASRHGAR